MPDLPTLLLLPIGGAVLPASGRAQEAASDPGEDWAVWYVDTFDRDAPPSLEVSGRGLVDGLRHLWARHLVETVRPDGQRGFSAFDLRWRHGRVHIAGPAEGAQRLRGWLFGAGESVGDSLGAADPVLLGTLAVAHAELLGRGQTSEPILSMASEADDRAAFERRLDDVAGR